MGYDKDNRGGRGRDRDRRDGGGGGGRDFYQPYGGERSGGDSGRGGFASRAAASPRRNTMPSQVVGEGKGVVKFFNRSKGFGFINNDAGGEDIFVHISAVEAANLSGVAEGQRLAFTIVDQGGKTSATNLVIEGELLPVVDSFGGGRDRDRGERSDRGDRGGFRREPRERTVVPRTSTGESSQGAVKFFNASKGFGFISREDGQADAFVHISAVEAAGMRNLNEGERFSFDLEVDGRGKTAAVNLVSIG
jgi:cold shock protein